MGLNADRLRVRVLYLGFLVAAAGTVLPGVVLPLLADRWGVGLAQAGTLLAAQFVASTTGALLSTYRVRTSLWVGQALFAVGLAGLALVPWPLTLVAALVAGFGLGLAVPATNVIVGMAAGADRGAALSRLNVVWGLGAMGCPLLFAVASSQGRVEIGLWVLSGLAGFVALALYRMPRPTGIEAQPSVGPGGLPEEVRRFAGVALLLLLAIGVETGISGWTVALSDQIGGGTSVVSLLIAGGFWAAMLVGRAATPRLLRRVPEHRVYAGALVLAAVGVLLLLSVDERAGIGGATLVAGLGMAPIFPLTVSLMVGIAQRAEVRVPGWVFALGGLGGAIAPWIASHIARAAGSVQPGLIVPLVGLVVAWLVHRRYGEGRVLGQAALRIK